MLWIVISRSSGCTHITKYILCIEFDLIINETINFIYPENVGLLGLFFCILIVYSQYLYGGQVAWKQSTGYWRMHVHRDWIRSLKFRFSYNRIVVVMCGLVFVISSTDCHRLVHVVTYCIVCSLLVTVRSQLISPRVLFIKVCPHKLAVGQLKRLTWNIPFHGDWRRTELHGASVNF